jgi:DnaJ-related protein SCJ1
MSLIPLSLFSLIYIFFFSITYIICEKDLYKILGVPREATSNEIKHKYRQLSRKYHPDKNKSPEAADMYKEINEAYEVLSDNKKRRLYDRGGMEAVNRDTQMENAGGDPFDIFSDFFGGGHRGHRQRENREADLRIKLRVSLKDLYKGQEYEFTYTRNAMCSHCRGSGADSHEDIDVCDQCGGKGIIVETKRLGPGFIQQFQRNCPKCNGRGKTIKKKCHVCKGNKIVKSLEEMTVYIEKGMKNGDEIKFDELGNESADKDPGHLIFIINEIGDKDFKREGNNLRYEMEISLKDALIGFEKKIKHLDGHLVTVKKDDISQPGDLITIRNEGMPIHQKGENGDLIVKLKIKLPEKLSEKQKEKLEKFFEKRQYW